MSQGREEPDPQDLEVFVDDEPCDYLGRANLMGGAIQDSMPEPVRDLFKSLVMQSRSVRIRYITAPSADHPKLAYYADD